jgi:hypothetical protein
MGAGPYTSKCTKSNKSLLLLIDEGKRNLVCLASLQISLLNN